MQRGVLVATLAVAVALATVPAGGLAQSGDASVAPGERFAAVVGVQEAEIDGEVESRAFRVRLARADGDSARAAVVAAEVNQTRERLQELERRRERLGAARENGTISEGQYRARVARLVAEARTLQHRLNRSADASRDLPDAALREHGVEPAAIQRLRGEADELTGPETAAIARGITGGDGPTEPGVPPGRDDEFDRGPPDGTANESGVDTDPSERAGSESRDRGAPDDARNRSDGATSPGGDAADRGEDATNRSDDRTPPRRGGATTDDGSADRAENGRDGHGTDHGGSRAANDSARGTDGDPAPPNQGGTGDGSADGNATDDRGNGQNGGSDGTGTGPADPDDRPGAGDGES